ncbi:hypothetical protein ODJ79_25015 [Actinoplanes sp. KI2]|uniref:hypothetical protein n=1 Tax=Actinoplanes sp. KI2 TaxID=2983315 RepID=UPI0021D5B8DD|nr:hypothetical protein [Actinoplanes sp. KI2]MCU7727002.1 hypothetical protein [Actinoplanes sp. KI2]
MSEFKIRKVEAANLIQGDGGQMIVNNAAVADLSRTVQANADAIRQIEAALAELRAELASRQPRPGRIRELLTTLGTGAGALTAVVEGIESLRQVAG